MIQNVSMARENGFVDIPSYGVLDIEETARYAPGDVCIICTGSQGEPMSALSLMAAHEHKHVKVSPDDIVVISAHAIPGNESNVSRVIDSLHRAGAEVVHDRTSPVHVSGHASQEELKFMLNLVSPEWFVPVHGEYRHLVHHARLAHEVGVPDDHVLVCEDGDVVTLTAEGADIERRAVPAGYMYVDGIVGDISHGVLRDRRMLSEEGVVVVIVTVDSATGEIVTGPEIVDARAGCTRPRPTTSSRMPSRSSATPLPTPPSRARPTSTLCGATPASRSPASSTSAPADARPSSPW